MSEYRKDSDTQSDDLFLDFQEHKPKSDLIEIIQSLQNFLKYTNTKLQMQHDFDHHNLAIHTVKRRWRKGWWLWPPQTCDTFCTDLEFLKRLLVVATNYPMHCHAWILES